MAKANKEIFWGGMYEFLIGEELVPFAMHKVLVSRYSDRLHDMMSSEPLNAPDTSSLLREVDTETFARFVEWAYTGTYNAAEPQEIAEQANNIPSYESEQNIEDSQSVEAVLEPPLIEAVQEPPLIEAVQEPPAIAWEKPVADGLEVAADEPPPTEAFRNPDTHLQDKTALSRKNNKKQKKNKKARQNDILSTNNVAVPHVEERNAIHEPSPDPDGSLYMGPFLIRYNRSIPDDSALSRSAHLLSHAKLWTFANSYSIAELCDLTTRKLSLSLQTIRYHQERVEDITALVRYVYAYVGAGGGSEKLREAVTSYTSDHFEELVQTEQFGELLRSGGQFVVDTSYMLGHRLRKECCKPDP